MSKAKAKKKFDGFYYSKSLTELVAKDLNGTVHCEGDAETGFRYYIMREELWPGELADVTNYPGMPFDKTVEVADCETTQRISSYGRRCLCCNGKSRFIVDTGRDYFVFGCSKCKVNFAVSWKRLNKLVKGLRYELRKQEMIQYAEGDKNGA